MPQPLVYRVSSDDLHPLVQDVMTGKRTRLEMTAAGKQARRERKVGMGKEKGIGTRREEVNEARFDTIDSFGKDVSELGISKKALIGELQAQMTRLDTKLAEELEGEEARANVHRRLQHIKIKGPTLLQLPPEQQQQHLLPHQQQHHHQPQQVCWFMCVSTCLWGRKFLSPDSHAHHTHMYVYMYVCARVCVLMEYKMYI